MSIFRTPVPEFEPNDELAIGVAALVEGEATAEQHASLGRRLADDPVARRWFIGFMQLHASLTWDASHLAGDSPEGAEVASLSQPSPFLPFLGNAFHGTIGFFSQEYPRALLISTVLTGLGLWIGSLIMVTHHVQIADESSSHVERPVASTREPEPKVEYVGRITGMVDCRWAEGSGFRGQGSEKVASGQWPVASDEGSGAGGEGQQNLPSPAGRGAGGEGGQSPIPNPPSLVALGDKFALASGLMEITYKTGAKVILQGPVTYEVESTNGGYLSVGKLTGKLEKKAEGATNLPSPFGRGAGGEGSPHNGDRDQPQHALTLALSQGERGPDTDPRPLTPDPFVIRTPTATVTDLGTEFGVEVSREGHTTSHVFRGTVEVQPTACNGQRGQKYLLTANESVQVEWEPNDKGLTVHRIAVDSAAFVRSEQLPKIAEELKLKPFRRWETYSSGLRSDPSLLAYYDFQKKQGSPSVLSNVADNGNRSFDGKIVGATWCRGRMYGKQALEFNAADADSRVDIHLPQQIDDLTLVAWVNIEWFGNVFNNLLMSDGWNRPGGVYWYFRSEDRHLFFNLAGAHGPWRFSPEFQRSQFNRWTHLAIVYDHAAGRIAFHKDGQLIDKIEPQGAATVRIGAARIGNWNSDGYTGPAKDGGFTGLIDELAIFGRPLAPKEIQAMFEAEKPLAAADFTPQQSTRSQTLPSHDEQ